MAPENTKTDLDIALELLKEEIEGAKQYKHYASIVTDPKVKQMLTDHMEDEKTHVSNLLSWVTTQTNAWLASMKPTSQK